MIREFLTKNNTQLDYLLKKPRLHQSETAFLRTTLSAFL